MLSMREDITTSLSERNTHDQHSTATRATKPGKPGKLEGPTYFLKISKDIRLLLYDILLADQQRRSAHLTVDLRQPRGDHHQTTVLRLVNRQIADETCPYLFRILDIGLMLTMCRYGNCFDDFRPVIAGRWDCIQHLELRSLDLSNCRAFDYIDNHIIWMPSPGKPTHIDATMLSASWASVGWPLEQRRVRTITIFEAEDIVKFQAFDDMVLYLALLVRFFSLLEDLRLVYGCSNGDAGAIDRYQIVGREVREWDTKHCKWEMPTVTFQDGPASDAMLRSHMEVRLGSRYYGDDDYDSQR